MKKLSFAVLAIMFFSCNFISCSGKDNLTVQKLIEKNVLKEFSYTSGDDTHDVLRESFDKKYYLDAYGNLSIEEEWHEHNILTFRHRDDVRFSHRNGLFFIDGIFIGLDYGEWGGKLIYQGFMLNDMNNIENIGYTILEDNILSIMYFKNNIYVLAGLSHLGYSSGRIYRLSLLNGEWTIDYKKEINGSPEAYTIYEDTLYMVTPYGLLTYDGRDVKNLLENQDWFGLYPQTMYVNDEIVAIGLKGCVAVINRKDNKVKHYRLRN